MGRLDGSGLVLRNNGTDDKSIRPAVVGVYTFTTPVMPGQPYDVTVGTQPTNPSEICTIANSKGTATSDVADADVTCVYSAFTVGGSVAGFAAGGSIVLTNGVDSKTITSNGTFTFATPVVSGYSYYIHITSQTSETCKVVAYQGTIGGGPVTTAVVACGTSAFYTVGGESPQGGVTGLNGSLKLTNGFGTGDEITVNGNGAFAFPTLLMGGGTAMYSVYVSQQPAYPPAAQNCMVTNGTGTVGATNVTNVGVACTTKSFTIGGAVIGLNGTLVLAMTNSAATVIAPVTMTADGGFTFADPFPSGSTYAVQVMTQPQGQQCRITSGTGTVMNSNVSNVSITCD